ncbi:hypothetical protein FQZ97_1022880 [compost metagenome]
MKNDSKLDELRRRKPISPITADEFARFLGAVASNTECEACGATSFSTINDFADDKNAAIFQSPIGMHTEERIGFITTLALMCEQCGLIRHHAYRKVQQWVDSHPAESDTDSSDQRTQDDGNE